MTEHSSGDGKNLQNYLLLPQAQVGLREVKEGARVEYVGSDTPRISPLVITSKPPDLVGLQSGGRSGLVMIDGVPYKMKGCRVEKALETEGLYRATHGWDDAEGGQLFPDADNEVRITNKINEILIAHGFVPVQEPVAIIRYGKMFLADYRPPWEASETLRNFVREFTLINPDKNLHELSASVMRIKGDTRLNELYRQKAHDKEAVTSVAYRFGLMAGGQKRVTEEYRWRRSEHTGNYVVFTDGTNVHTTMNDFEDTDDHQHLSFRFLNSWRRNSEVKRIFRSMNRSGLVYQLVYWANGVKGLPGFRASWRLRAPEYFREAFRRGFMEGYRNPDRRESVTREDLRAAYGLAM